MTQHATFQDTSKRVAVFVDGDNLNADWAETILVHAKKFGRIDTSRVYTNYDHAPNWKDTTGFRHVSSGCGKNATDIMLCIDAITLALTESTNTVVIGTSDQDFRHLAHSLKERGIMVVGIGTTVAPPAFRDACHIFRELISPLSSDTSCEAQGQRPSSKFDRNVCHIIAQHAPSPHGLPLTALNPLMTRQFNTRISDQPDKQWRTYLERRNDLYALDPRGPNAKVRLTKTARAALVKT
ncbi:NYN domain-containing protein [Marivita sp. S6314]|uniref:NYN domain-containing protein n=1 Tax=Marivita sp. S6314 TaxID=2926406 RepID=UPI001FF1CDBC|nr:NYN domain-containing protein [Marivita sp. S6314]MCK0151784.1 NYN domain-containing protein [Marivita sp. S6314]